MRKRNTQVFIAILVIFGIALWAVLSTIHWSVPGGGRFDREDFRLGLDLKGGTHLVYQADLSGVSATEGASRMQGALKVIEGRVNAYGVSEATVQQQGSDRISIQLPGVRDINEAIRLVGQTAHLDFREQVTEGGETKWVAAKGTVDGEEKELTGAYFKPNAEVVFNSQTGEPHVAFEFDSNGAKLFEQITKRNLNKPLGIFLDDQIISAPTVRAVISDKGIIEGLTLDEARTLKIQLNAGALPVPLALIQQQDVDATLGADSIRKSLMAGVIGLALVLLFMVLYYRVSGALAGVALIIYATLLLALFKLIPVTLTLAGIAALILSIGMAVDANVLIFERLKEEIRAGKSLGAAIEAGFNRAWPSIRDSNVSTFITCIILYWFGHNFGAALVMGFALTLGIGVAVSMFTAMIVTRTLMRLFVGSPLAARLKLFTVPGQKAATSGGKG